MSLFSRRRDQPEDPQAVVDQLAHQRGSLPAGYSGPVTAGGQPGTAPPLAGGRPGGDFQLTIEDVFDIKGRGVVVTGMVAAGQVSPGMPVTVYRAGTPIGSHTVTGIEMFRKQVNVGTAGQNVGLLLSATDRSAVQPGDELGAR